MRLGENGEKNEVPSRMKLQSRVKCKGEESEILRASEAIFIVVCDPSVNEL